MKSATSENKDPLIIKALGCFNGNQTRLAEAMTKFTPNSTVRQGHVWQWLNCHKQIGPKFAVAMEKATKEADPEKTVYRWELLPDIFEPATGQPGRSAA